MTPRSESSDFRKFSTGPRASVPVSILCCYRKRSKHEVVNMPLRKWAFASIFPLDYVLLSRTHETYYSWKTIEKWIESLQHLLRGPLLSWNLETRHSYDFSDSLPRIIQHLIQ